MIGKLPSCIMCFNTQPPEGGCSHALRKTKIAAGFNTQPPEGGWLVAQLPECNPAVSTHSRLKAAVG